MAFPYSSGDVLTAADLNQSSGLVLVKAQAVGSGVSSVAVSSAFNSNFDAYKITYTGGVLSTQTDFNIVLNNASVQYYQWMVYGSGGYGSSTVSGATTSNTTQFNWAGGGNTGGSVLSVELYNPYLATHTYFTNSGFYNVANESGFSAGVNKTTNSHTGFTIATGTGTMTGGTISVYGYNNG